MPTQAARWWGICPKACPAALARLAAWSDLGSLLMPVLVVTLVSFLETASSAKVESQRSSERWNENQDLIGQGSVQNQQRSVRQLCHQRILFALCHQPVCGRTNGLGHGVFDWRGAGGAAVAHTCAVRAHLGAGGIVVTAVFSLIKPSSITGSGVCRVLSR